MFFAKKLKAHNAKHKCTVVFSRKIMLGMLCYLSWNCAAWVVIGILAIPVGNLKKHAISLPTYLQESK